MKNPFKIILQKVGLSKTQSTSQLTIPEKTVKKRLVFKRSYDAGRPDRTKPIRLFGNNSINGDIKTHIKNARSNADEQLKNSGIMRGLMLHRESDILGENGFIFQSLATHKDGTPDLETRKIIEDAFNDWSSKEHCTMSGKYSLYAVQLLDLWSYKRDGEIIVRTVADPSKKYGMALQLLDPRDLDETYDDVINGNEVVMGVEHDEWDRDIAYYFKRKDSYGRYKNEKPQRIEADEIIFTFKPEHVKQKRGITHFATALSVINGLGDWIGAMLEKAINNASILGFFKKTANAEAPEFTGDDNDRTVKFTDEDGTEHELPVWDLEKAIYRFLPEGYEKEDTDNEFPAESHAEFVKTGMRVLGSGTGDDYSTVANDRSNENYSSLRSGKLTAQGIYKVEQTFLILQHYQELGRRWIKFALASGALQGLSYANINNYLKHTWQPRTFPWVDPLKDVQAVALELSLGLRTRTEIIRSRYGRDISEVRKEYAQEIEDDKKAGLDFLKVKEITATSTENNDDSKQNNNDQGDGSKSTSILKMKLG